MSRVILENPDPPSFTLEAADLRRRAQSAIGIAVGDGFRGVKARKVPAQYLARRVAFDVLRALVPAQHAPFGVKHVDGVALRALDQMAKSLFALAQRSLGPHARGDVVRHDERSAPPGKLDRVRDDLGVDEAAVFQPVLPHAGVAQRRPLGGHELQQAVDLLGRPDVGDAHAQELVACVAVLGYGGVVDFEKSQRLRVVDPHGVGVAGKQGLKALRAGAGFRFDPIAAAPLAADRRKQDDDGRRGERGVGRDAHTGIRGAIGDPSRYDPVAKQNPGTGEEGVGQDGARGRSRSGVTHHQATLTQAHAALAGTVWCSSAKGAVQGRWCGRQSERTRP